MYNALQFNPRKAFQMEHAIHGSKGARPMSQFSEAFGPDLLTTGAAVGGSLVAQILNTKVVSVRKMCSLGLAGAITGIFCSPALSDALTIGAANYHARAAIAFATGLLGIAVVTVVMRFAETTSFPAFLARLFGVQLPPGVIPPNGSSK
jgi:hypothetical protein